MGTLARQKRRIAYFLPVLMGMLGIVFVAVAILPVAGKAGESSDSSGKKDELGNPAASTAGPSLSLVDGAILGIVEGVTEYLPVSSTGHLLLTEHILGLADDPETKRAANAYAIVIQAGAILAVLGLYRSRIRQMLLGLMGRDASGRRLAINLVIAFLPAGVAALLLGDVIKSRLFGLWPVTAAWFVGGIALFVLDRKRPHDAPGLALEDFGWRHALGIGLMQCAALWPGVSRSLATIAGGLLMGASMGAAVEFSFLLGLITLGAATVYEACKSGNMIIASFGLMAPLLGFFCALISAWVSIKWMVSFLQRRGLALFGWYRIVLALVVAAVMVTRAR
jgi:undecaprenyl-diphosphatase